MIVKPPRLRTGDTVAAISMSNGYAALMPDRYAVGKQQIEATFGVKVIETPNAMREPDWLYRNPKARADDLHWALCNDTVRAIFSTIGGYESVRTLPHLDHNLNRQHPKIMMGASDTTVTLTAFLSAGVVAFNGPPVMCDLAENRGIRPFVADSVRAALFAPQPFLFQAAESWTEEFLEWTDPASQSRERKFIASEGWVWLQGTARASGRLVGGCIEALEFLKGTPWWIPKKLWDGAIFFLETSDEAPTPKAVSYWLRNYGSQGILERISGMLIARPARYTREMTDALYAEIRRVLAEFSREDLPVVANMDFGHTSPQMVVPLGCRAMIDPVAKRVAVLESPVA